VEEGETVVLTVARRPVTVQLDRLPVVEESGAGWETGQARLDGDTYVRSVFSYTDDYCDSPTILQYDLGRNYRSFSTRVGPSDESYSQTLLQFDVRLDGRSVFSGKAKLGESLPIEVDVTDGLRLELSVARLESPCGSWDDDVFGVWADPVLQGSPDEVPTIPASPTS
jgi:hypothetical protein